jgi:serine/threonine-protein kinase
VNPALGNGRPAQRGQAAPPRQVGGGTANTGRVTIPPPRQTPARAPAQEGLGCGIFLVGMLILAGVLGLVLLFSSGALNGLFGSIGGGARTTTPGQITDPTAIGEPTATPDLRVSVPTLVGLSDGSAQEQLLQLKLVPAPQTQNSPTISQGLVISQTIPPGQLLEPGQPVTYTVSLGPTLVTVPDVTRVPVAIAQSQLSALGLQATIVEEPNTSVDAGFVIAQSPSASLRIAQGEVVRLRVSRGDVVRFPDVIGKQRAEAEAILAGTAGLTLEFVDVQGRDRLIDFDSYAPGQVVSAQAVDGPGLKNGDLIPRGSRIILGVRAEN